MKREKLLNVLEHVKPGLAAKEIVEHSRSFIFTGKHVMAHNDETSAKHPLKTEFEGAVPAETLLKYLQRIDGDEIGIDHNDSELILKCGRSKVGIPLAAEVPDYLTSLKVPKKGWAPLPKGFGEAARFCSFSASKDMTHPVLTCIHFSPGLVESSDQMRATRHDLEDRFDDDFLVPATSARHLHGFGAVEYVKAKAWVHFRNEDKAVLSFRLFAGEYIDDDGGNLLDPLFNVKGAEFKLPKAMRESLDRAGVFSVAEFDTDRFVKVVVRDGKLKIRAEGDAGWFEERMKAKSMPDLNFTIHPDLLKEILAHSRVAVMGQHGLLFEGDDFQHVVWLQVEGD